MTQYIAITFAPVQGFIEKSRKLRDLYGASGILSYLSSQVIEQAKSSLPEDNIISPGISNVKNGTPNRIFLKLSDEQDAKELLKELESTFFAKWREILKECKEYVKKQIQSIDPKIDWCWDEEWNHWGNHAWEFFGEIAEGDRVEVVRDKLENTKLSRNWIAINWIGESSSLSGSDAIAFPKLGAKTRNPKTKNWSEEEREIKKFYRRLAFLLDGVNKPDDQEEDKEPEGKFIAANERLSIPELTKRLVTVPDVARKLPGMPSLDRSFKDIVRKPEDNPHGNVGQWTGWFMGDGDNVGKYLKNLSTKPNADLLIHNFSKEMGEWGEWFEQSFSKELGRIIYAGGDDFLGVIYNQNFPESSQDSVSGLRILEWLNTLNQDWKHEKSEETNKNITLSLGFVWAAPGVPLRDVLQHCREAEQQSKKRGRNRVTIRVVFNNGQYIDWTTPWEYLKILTRYQDLDGGSNWSHVYGDLAQLKSRHAFGFNCNDREVISSQDIMDNYDGALDFLDIYYPGYKSIIKNSEQKIAKTGETVDKAWAITQWIQDMIAVGWHLCSEPKTSSLIGIENNV